MIEIVNTGLLQLNYMPTEVMPANLGQVQLHPLDSELPQQGSHAQHLCCHCSPPLLSSFESAPALPAALHYWPALQVGDRSQGIAQKQSAKFNFKLGMQPCLLFMQSTFFVLLVLCCDGFHDWHLKLFISHQRMPTPLKRPPCARRNCRGARHSSKNQGLQPMR
jgi:hypothetical protein